MDTIENLAISEPLCAKTLGLNAINKDDPGREEKYEALGLTIPPASVCRLKRDCVLTLSSFPTKNGMLGGVIRFIEMWKSCSRRLTRQGKHGIGMLYF